MSSIRTHRGIVAFAAFLVAIGAGALAMRAAAQASATAKAEGAAAAAAQQSSAGRYFEMRTYHAAPGKIDALHARFREHTIRLFKKHGIESVAYWNVAADEEAGGKDTLVFILAYPDKAARDKMWTAFAEDPEWKNAKEESEKSGPLVEKVEQTFMTPTDYSPLK